MSRLPLSRPHRVVFCLAVLASIALAPLAHGGASQLPSGFTDTPLATSLDAPVGLARVPDPSGRPVRILFVEQRTARVGLIVGSSVLTVGTVPNVAGVDFERGLLGVAVDPDFPTAPYIYVHYTDSRSGNHVAISRFTLTGDLSDTGSAALQFSSGSRYDLRRDLPDTSPNHNGGTVRFGPDKKLYVSVGDDEQGCPAQDPHALVGKILRLDVSRLPALGSGPAPYALLTAAGNPFATSADSTARLVWASGLRNPFRFQIDPLDGALWISDVGENGWEELDRVTSGGTDLGWPLFEGPDEYSTCAGVDTSGMLGPVYAYTHAAGLVIISAGVYRRPAAGAARFPAEYDGDAFLLDYYTGILRRLHASGGGWVIADPVAGQSDPDNFGTGFTQVSDVIPLLDGSLVYVRQGVNFGAGTGEVRRIAYTAVTEVPLERPTSLTFAPPIPSPSRGAVTFAWSQRSAGTVRLSVIDAAGREVRELLSAVDYGPGSHVIAWDGRAANGEACVPGVYFARLRVGAENRVVRVVISR